MIGKSETLPTAEVNRVEVSTIFPSSLSSSEVGYQTALRGMLFFIDLVVWWVTGRVQSMERRSPRSASSSPTPFG